MAGHEDDLAPEPQENQETQELSPEDKIEILNGLLTAAQGIVAEPERMVDFLRQGAEGLAQSKNEAEFNDDIETLNIDPADELVAEIFTHFLARYNPNELSREALGQQIEAIIETARIDDDETTPQEALASLIIAGGFVDGEEAMGAESFQLATDLLTDMGMADQIDTYGTTLAYYIDNALDELQEFVNDPTPRLPFANPEPPTVERDASWTPPGNGQGA